ncbi:two-component system QseEF-associated lipoprotein QseG [Cronobacter muytjensii]|uniref:two-component system QseEF-associated lipoprotein QseG n=1 Tax=Cronobacter muytjensii TaxID=413501 RepID=UPI0034D545D8
MNSRLVSAWRSLRARGTTSFSLRRLACSALLPCLLAGCVQSPVSSNIKQHRDPKLPEQQLADFLFTDCSGIWQLSGQSVESNPLFWLRGMDCAERLAPAEARAQARSFPDETWQHAFRRGILLANARITPAERRNYLTTLSATAGEIPAHVRPLYEAWRDGQAAQLALSEERGRYSKLQQSADSELDALREQQRHLRSQLELTTRKLENLTDIERQLSTRKSAGGYIQDSSHNPDGTEKENAAPIGKDTAPAQEETRP